MDAESLERINIELHVGLLLVCAERPAGQYVHFDITEMTTKVCILISLAAPLSVGAGHLL
jgi:hypothetical protein